MFSPVLQDSVHVALMLNDRVCPRRHGDRCRSQDRLLFDDALVRRQASPALVVLCSSAFEPEGAVHHVQLRTGDPLGLA